MKFSSNYKVSNKHISDRKNHSNELYKQDLLEGKIYQGKSLDAP